VCLPCVQEKLAGGVAGGVSFRVRTLGTHYFVGFGTSSTAPTSNPQASIEFALYHSQPVADANDLRIWESNVSKKENFAPPLKLVCLGNLTCLPPLNLRFLFWATEDMFYGPLKPFCDASARDRRAMCWQYIVPRVVRSTTTSTAAR